MRNSRHGNHEQTVYKRIEASLKSQPCCGTDYPLDCRKTLYEAVKAYWESADENPFVVYKNAAPVVSITLKIDYTEEDESYGALSDFIIDLDDAFNTVIITVSFDVPLNVGETLAQCKEKYDSLLASSDHADAELCIASVVQDSFPSLFEMNIATVNPGNPEDMMLRSKNDLKGLFCVRTIKAERSLDESETASENPLGQIMKKLFDSEIDDVEEELRPALEGLQGIISDVNFNVQNRVTAHMDTIVSSMTPFGYPDGEDLKLKANTSIALEKRIIDTTELAYVSPDAGETLPDSHNGLGYKNLIKISMELHDFARTVKADRQRTKNCFRKQIDWHPSKSIILDERSRKGRTGSTVSRQEHSYILRYSIFRNTEGDRILYAGGRFFYRPRCKGRAVR